MKKVNLAIIGMKPLPQGGVAVLTRPGKDNPSPNGVHVLNAKQAERIALRLGIGVRTLNTAIRVSRGQAVLTMDAISHKAGDAWENKVTGQKGTYGAKNDGKDWVEYRNHEIELGLVADLKLLEIQAQGDNETFMYAAAEAAPIAVPANRPVAITDATDSSAKDSTGSDAAKADIEA